MKIDSMTAAAVGFAAFAAWFALKPKTASAASAAGAVFGQATSQRQQVGAALNLNTDYLSAWGGNMPSMGGGQGLLPAAGPTSSLYSFT